MKKWFPVIIIGFLAVPVARLVQNYLSYMELAMVIVTVIILLIPANILVNKWRRKNEMRLAAILLSMSKAEQQQALNEVPEDTRQRVLELMQQMAPNKSLKSGTPQSGAP